MMQQRILAASAAALVFMTATVHAQGSIAGKWDTSFDTGIKNENGEITSMGKRAATMTLRLKGDSVLGTWQVAAIAGSPAPAPVQLRGIRNGSKVDLRADPVERTINMGQGPQQVKMIAVYHFELKGDGLEGTAQNTSADGQFDGPVMPFSAKRAKP